MRSRADARRSTWVRGASLLVHEPIAGMPLPPERRDQPRGDRRLRRHVLRVQARRHRQSSMVMAISRGAARRHATIVPRQEQARPEERSHFLIVTLT